MRKGAEGAVKLKLKPEVSEEVGLNEVPVLTYRQAEAFTFAPGVDIQFLASRNIRVNLFGEYHYLRPDYAVFRVTDINPMDGSVEASVKIAVDNVNLDFMTFGISVDAMIW